MMSRQFIRSALMLHTALKPTTLAPLSTVSSHYIHCLNTRPSSLSTPHRFFCSEASALADDDILDRIKKVFGEMERAKLDDSKPLTAQSHIFNDIGLDSLDFVEFGIALEDEFGIEIEDEKAEGIVTVGDAIQLIKESPNAA